MDQLLTVQSFVGAIHPMFESTGILAFCYKVFLLVVQAAYRLQKVILMKHIERQTITTIWGLIPEALQLFRVHNQA